MDRIKKATIRFGMKIWITPNANLQGVKANILKCRQSKWILQRKCQLLKKITKTRNGYQCMETQRDKL